MLFVVNSYNYIDLDTVQYLVLYRLTRPLLPSALAVTYLHWLPYIIAASPLLHASEALGLFILTKIVYLAPARLIFIQTARRSAAAAY